MNKITKDIKELGIDTSASIVGAGAGLIVAGPPGALIGSIFTPVLSYVLKKKLSEKEKDRIEKVYELTKQKIKEKIKLGCGLRKDLSQQKLIELTEGTLLKSKDTYEERKLPLIANLLSTAPFTSTPLENLNQTLITAEQLSYQQLCLLSIFEKNHYPNPHLLSDQPFYTKKSLQFNEKAEGIYHDIFSMIKSGLLIQTPKKARTSLLNVFHAGYIVPAYLLLEYPGRLLCNGLQLSTISNEELYPLINILEK